MKLFIFIVALALFECTFSAHAGSQLASVHKRVGKGFLAAESPVGKRTDSKAKSLRPRCIPRSLNSTLALASPAAPAATPPAYSISPVSSTSAQAPQATTASSPSVSSASASGHQFTLTNKCPNSITPIIADTKCGYSPRCSDASAFSGSQPGVLAPGQTKTVIIDNDWVGRIFAQDGSCGPSGENCSMMEFNLDSGSFYTPQAYDISNIQGFTQSMSVGAAGCETSTCTNINCGCTNAYPVGDMTGCGNDLPVKGCGAGPISFDVVFCP